MSYKVKWTDVASGDLNEIVRYIAVDNVDSALAVLDSLETKAESLTNLPERGRILPELIDIGIAQYREIIVKPWRIVYRIEQEQVLVTGVLDGRRDLQSLLLTRFSRT